jgi:hypothetical protein
MLDLLDFRKIPLSLKKSLPSRIRKPVNFPVSFNAKPY